MEEKIRVFLDSNVLFSIAYTGRENSRSYLIYEIQSAGILKVYLSGLVCKEAVFNIKIKKPERLNFLNELIKRSKVLDDVLVDTENESVSSLPQNDRIILTTAVSNSMDYFITGNKKVKKGTVLIISKKVKKGTVLIIRKVKKGTVLIISILLFFRSSLQPYHRSNFIFVLYLFH